MGATIAPDLAVSNVTFTPADVSENQNVSISFDVTNLGTVATSVGKWVDSVYLSTQTAVDSSAVLLGRIAHSGDLTSQESYSENLTAPVPGLLVASYHVIVVADSGLVVPDINRTNNTGVAPTELSTQPPLLNVGTSFSSAIADGQDLYYRLNVTPGTNVKLDATFATLAEADVYVGFGALPTAGNSEQSATDVSDLTPELILPSGQGGAYYVWLHGLAGASAGEPFTLLASLLTFSASAFTPSSASSQGLATMDVTGSGFTANSKVSLTLSGGQTVNAQSVTLISPTELNATFDLTSVSAGNYNVLVTDSGKTSTAPGSFQVVAQAVPSIEWVLQIDREAQAFYTNPPPGFQIPPSFPNLNTVLTGASGSGSSGGGSIAEGGPPGPFQVELYIINRGTNDVTIPALQVTVTNTIEEYYDIPATTLAPYGSPGDRLVFSAEPDPYPDTPGTQCNVSIQELPSEDAVDWGSVVAGERPTTIAPDAWSAIISNVISSVGTTVGTLDAALQADAIYLAQVGDAVTQQQDLVKFEVLKAEDLEPMPTLASVVDKPAADPGLSLDFQRSFGSSLPGRYQLGLLGYGWASNWDISALADTVGDVFIRQGAVSTEFTPVGSSGKYTNTTGNGDVLTIAQGSYVLTAQDGTITAFLPDGQLDYVKNRNGNQITAGYGTPGGHLTSLTDSNGDTLTFNYNGDGLVSQINNAAGSTFYQYDAYDQLISVSSAQGIYQYTYVNGQGLAQEHALASITNPDGTHTYYQYDIQGRLIKQSQDGGANAIAYAYLSPGGYTETNGSGATTKVLYDHNGEPAVITDPLGNAYNVAYNATGLPVLVANPGGTATSYQYDSKGDLLSATDSLGSTSQLTIDPQTGEPATFTNANGKTTSFGYNTNGDLTSITQPDSTAAKNVYDSRGDVIQSIDALGRSTHYTYDSYGRMILRNNPDGTSITYGYDSSPKTSVIY